VAEPRPVRGLVGAYNFRDLGGLRCADGRRVRHGLLHRSDTLQALTPDDVRYLVDEVGIELVVDLRRGGEAVAQGRGLLAETTVTYLNVPLAEAPEASQHPPREQTLIFYLDHLRSPTSALPMLVQMLAAVAGRPVLVHCAAGKDRTGLVVALLLSLLGVDRGEIVADYLATDANMPRIVERMRGWPHYAAHMAAVPPELYETHEHSITGFLDALERDHGGAEGWAAERGIPAEAIARLRERCTEAAG